MASARGLKPYEVLKLVQANTEGRTFGLLGEPRVNVLKLNLALDGAYPIAKSTAVRKTTAFPLDSLLGPRAS